MKLYSYILAYDPGSAPNPFHGMCTLCICKPAIRRTARVGNWVMGTGPARNHTKRKLVYAMRITEILPLNEYFRDPRFQDKRPDLKSADPHRRVGDNVCRQNPDGTWTQLPGPRDPESFQTDLSGKNALISNHFYYFGTEAVDLPDSMQKLIHTNQGHLCNFPDFLVKRFVTWLEKKYQPGVHGEPTDMALADNP